MDLNWFGDVLRNIDWSMLSNIAVVASAAFIIWQIREMRGTTHAQAFSVAVEHLQNEKVRQARRMVFKLRGKQIDRWSREEIEAAEMVCHTYDVVGQMVRHRLLPKEIIIDSWGQSLRNGWPILSLLVHKYREDYVALEYWDDYEWLAIEAYKIERRRQIKKRLLKFVDFHWLVSSVKSQLVRSNLLKQAHNGDSRNAPENEQSVEQE